MSEVSLFESLESRRLLTGASFHDGVVRVHGNVENRNIITVTNSTDGKAVDVSISWVTALKVKKNFSASFPKTLGIRKINVFGGIRNDTVNVGLVNGDLGIKTRIDSGRGNDVIATGSEADAVYAGKGNDTVLAGGGADLIYGGLGDDNLGGEGGNDTIWGGNGNDIVDGGSGDDKLGGVLGKNTLLGRSGKDTFVVRSLEAKPTNDFNTAEDVLVIKPSPDDADAPAGVTM